MPEETREASHKTESALREKSNPSASSLTWVPVQEREEAIVLLEVFEAVSSKRGELNPRVLGSNKPYLTCWCLLGVWQTLLLAPSSLPNHVEMGHRCTAMHGRQSPAIPTTGRGKGLVAEGRFCLVQTGWSSSQ